MLVQTLRTQTYPSIQLIKKIHFTYYWKKNLNEREKIIMPHQSVSFTTADTGCSDAFCQHANISLPRKAEKIFFRLVSSFSCKDLCPLTLKSYIFWIVAHDLDINEKDVHACVMPNDDVFTTQRILTESHYG